MNKKSTIFCDIDGTLLKYRKFETYKTCKAEPIENTINLINNTFDNGHSIVLTTARPEYLRTHTLIELNNNDVKFHQLIMGIERGNRILVNDNETPNINKAYVYNLERNKGFTNKNINEIKALLK